MTVGRLHHIRPELRAGTIPRRHRPVRVASAQGVVLFTLLEKQIPSGGIRTTSISRDGTAQSKGLGQAVERRLTQRALATRCEIFLISPVPPSH